MARAGLAGVSVLVLLWFGLGGLAFLWLYRVGLGLAFQDGRARFCSGWMVSAGVGQGHQGDESGAIAPLSRFRRGTVSAGLGTGRAGFSGLAP